MNNSLSKLLSGASHALAGVVFLAVPSALAQNVNLSQPVAARARPVRFLLTFDDGPYGQERNNPTEWIFDSPAVNKVQNGMKAIFFVQTRSSDDGATERGRALMRREQAEGHLLALHDGAAWGHRSHRNLSDITLEKSLSDGVADLLPVAGRRVTLVRPTLLVVRCAYLGCLSAPWSPCFTDRHQRQRWQGLSKKIASATL